MESWCRERRHFLRGTTITWIEEHPLIPPVGRGHLQHDDSPSGHAEEAEQRLHGKRVIGLTFASRKTFFFFFAKNTSKYRDGFYESLRMMQADDLRTNNWKNEKYSNFIRKG